MRWLVLCVVPGCLDRSADDPLCISEPPVLVRPLGILPSIPTAVAMGGTFRLTVECNSAGTPPFDRPFDVVTDPEGAFTVETDGAQLALRDAGASGRVRIVPRDGSMETALDVTVKSVDHLSIDVTPAESLAWAKLLPADGSTEVLLDDDAILTAPPGSVLLNDGKFLFDAVAPGTYAVTIESAGRVHAAPFVRP